VLRFGTDGVRGDAGVDLTSTLVVALGRAIARVLGAPRILIGCDTRESGARIESDVALGLAIEGVTPVLLGVMPTPAIAFLAAQHAAPAAIVSASHNPWTDNGVKIIGADGFKLADDVEAAIETELHELIDDGRIADGGVVPTESLREAADAYTTHLLGALGGRTLDGLSVVLDCANGAAFALAPRVFRAAGARVSVMHAIPDGRNINAGCGSTHPESLQDSVRDPGAALGLAFDGDADRVLAVDEHGELVDGDQIMMMTALDLRERGALRNDGVAITVMSNLGLRRAFADAGIEVVETPVGDRQVVAAMRAHDLAMGGEQSGHIVYADHATTGDGLLTGLLICDLMCRSGSSLSVLAAAMTRYPQVLVNVRGARRRAPETTDTIAEEVRIVERELGERGRVLVRASGTEPLVRIMVEAESRTVAEAAAERLRAVVEAELGTS
jgi:phosphoglucosamine mutase